MDAHRQASWRQNAGARGLSCAWLLLALLMADPLHAADTLPATAPATSPANSPADLAALDVVPEGFEGATVTIKPDARVPLDTQFTDENGRRVTLRDFFHPGRPVILAPVYYNCPMLCNLTLNGVVNAIKPLALTPGKEFEFVAISFNPKEPPELAKAKKWQYLKELGKPEAADGWHFLTSPDDQARQVCDAIGFGYKLDPQSGQYLHQAAIYIVMPDGRVSRVLPGTFFEPQLVQDSLTYAAEGRIGSRLFRLATSCGLLHYDPVTGRYRSNPWVWAGTVGGGVILLTVGSLLVTLWRYEARRPKAPPADDATT